MHIEKKKNCSNTKQIIREKANAPTLDVYIHHMNVYSQGLLKGG